MKTFQTKCSSCHHVFTITDTQLKFKNGLARCGHCDTIFSALDNLVQQKELTPSQREQLENLKAAKQQFNATSTTEPSRSPKQKNSVVSFDDLLSENLSDKSTSPEIKEKHHTQNQRPSSITKPVTSEVSQEAPNVEFDIIEDFDSLPDTQHYNSKSVLSNIDGQENFTEQEETWLEDLLAKESQKVKNKPPADLKITPMHREPNDVSNLLDQFGVSVSEEKALEHQEYLTKLQKRFDKKPTAQQIVKKSSIGMLVVWIFGCLFLSVLLVVQYGVFHVNTLIKDPKMAIQIDKLCATLHLPCNLPSADLNQLNINVLSINANGENSDLVFSLTNQDSSKQLLYPDLKINLQMGNNIVSQMIVPVSAYAENNITLGPQQVKPVKLRIHLPQKQFEQANIEAFY